MPHFSVVNDPKDLLSRVADDDVVRTCDLCHSGSMYTAKDLREQNVHIGGESKPRYVETLGKFLLLCKQRCIQSECSHYHCPVCDKGIDKKNRLIPHVKLHEKDDKCEIPNRKKKFEKGEYLIQCVDKNRGIYMVNCHTRGPRKPIHVLRIGNSITIRCTDKLCHMAMSYRNLLPQQECPHLRCCVIKSKNNVPIQRSPLLSSDAKYQRVIDLLQKAVAANSPLSVKWKWNEQSVRS